MLSPFKNIIALLLLLFACSAFAQEFYLKTYVDKDGNPDPGGKPFEQYFRNPDLSDAVISIGGCRRLFRYETTCEGIRKNHLDVINWEIEKAMRCNLFRLSQIMVQMPYDKNSVIDFLQVFPEGSGCIAPVFYLWMQISKNCNYLTVLAKMGKPGKKYAKDFEENNPGIGMSTNPEAMNSEFFRRCTSTSFESLMEDLRNCANSYRSDDPSPEDEEYFQVRILQMLEHKTAPEIVKYMLDNDIIKIGNMAWLTLFLEMCPEWPPEVIAALKKKYTSTDREYEYLIRNRIVAVSVRNQEMMRWLKPYMAEFAATRKGMMSVKVPVAYMLIAGETDPVKILRHYVRGDVDPADFVYEYARATGKYNDAYRNMGISRPNITKMLYDKSDLTMENRIILLKQLFGINTIDVKDDSAKTIVIPDAIVLNLSKQSRQLHPDNLPALIVLTKDRQCAQYAWLAIKAFPVSEMPPEFVTQYFAHCKQELKSSDSKVRNEAIRCLRFFTPDAQRPEAVKLLFKLLLSNDSSVVAAADESLTAMGPACIPELLKFIGGSEPFFAVRACEFIGAMGLYGHEAAPELIKLLNVSSDWMLKTMIIKALALIKGTEAVPEIEKYVSAKQPMLAETATQALILLKPIPKEILNDPSDFVKNYSNPGAR